MRRDRRKPARLKKAARVEVTAPGKTGAEPERYPSEELLPAIESWLLLGALYLAEFFHESDKGKLSQLGVFSAIEHAGLEQD